ncbi:MAG TPA: tetraacyldisaccharide 4'-kinase [Casimicrobiaceae bacterium]|nr:tetraacyldisaccharide 4'-kinase [Casimicrobiaceae bacterium]
MASSDRVLAAWYARRPTALAVALAPLSGVFAAAVAARRALYRHGMLRVERVRAPVVVVGNVTAGGSGKTPLAIALAGALAERGWHPGFVSRGYGRRSAEARIVRPGDAPDDVGDEPLLLAATGRPVAIGRRRVEAARRLLDTEPGCDRVIADDGLQHYQLARDVEIAAVDDDRALGNGLMLPAGPLREPPSRLRDVDAVVRLVAGDAWRAAEDPRETLMAHEPVRWRNLADPARHEDPATFRPEAAWAIAGTANPQRFFALVARLGIDARTRAFPDHHRYVAGDLALPGARAILMTAKDAVKCARWADERCWVLDIRARIDPALVDRIEEKLTWTPSSSRSSSAR